MKTNITYIISNINKSLAFEWLAIHLNKEKFNLNFILINTEDSELESFLKQNKILVDRISYKSKINIPKAVYLSYKIFKKHKTTIVHAHLFNANIIGLTAAWLARIPKRIYTRHHSNYHYNYHPEAVKYDKIVNYFSTDIIAISKVVKDILIKKEGVPNEKIHVIYHGFLFDQFINVSESAVNNLKQKYIPTDSYPIVGVISRYIELKGIQYIIPAFKKLLKLYPNAFLILANTSGNYKNQIQKSLQTIPKTNYIEITFETDIFSLYKLFNIFIHTPIDENCEAFGQTYIESMASGVPLIATKSGIANEILIDKNNCLLVPYKNSDSIYEAMLKIIEEPRLKETIINNSLSTVKEIFALQRMIEKLENLYLH